MYCIDSPLVISGGTILRHYHDVRKQPIWTASQKSFWGIKAEPFIRVLWVRPMVWSEGAAHCAVWPFGVHLRFGQKIFGLLVRKPNSIASVWFLGALLVGAL